MDNFLKAEGIIQRQREQRNSVKGKRTPYRMKYTYACDTVHYYYFETKQQALSFNDACMIVCPIGYYTFRYPVAWELQEANDDGEFPEEFE